MSYDQALVAEVLSDAHLALNEAADATDVAAAGLELIPQVGLPFLRYALLAKLAVAALACGRRDRAERACRDFDDMRAQIELAGEQQRFFRHDAQEHESRVEQVRAQP